MHASARQYLAAKQAEDTRAFLICTIGLVLGLAVMLPGAGLIILSEKLVTTGVWHDILNTTGKIIDWTGLLIMLGSFGWATVRDLK